MKKILVAFVIVLLVYSINPKTAFALQYSIGHTWSFVADWTNRPDADAGTTNGNPDDDSMGVPVYSYERFIGVPENAGLNASQPWYKYPTTPLVWDISWYGQTSSGTWVLADNQLPNSGSSVITTTRTGISLMRWINPCDVPVDVVLSKAGTWYYGFQTDDSSADWAICLVDASDGNAISVIYSQHTEATSVNTGDQYLTFIDEFNIDSIRVEPGDSIFVTSKQVSGSTWSTFVCPLEITLVSVAVPEPGTIGMLSLGIIALIRKIR